jgi:hypothetical protein
MVPEGHFPFDTGMPCVSNARSGEPQTRDVPGTGSIPGVGGCDGPLAEGIGGDLLIRLEASG